MLFLTRHFRTSSFESCSSEDLVRELLLDTVVSHHIWKAKIKLFSGFCPSIV